MRKTERTRTGDSKMLTFEVSKERGSGGKGSVEREKMKMKNGGGGDKVRRWLTGGG